MNSISLKKKTSSATVPAWLVLLMAACAGITVANIYYCQPILKEIASEFNVSESSVGMIPMLSQIGYGLDSIRLWLWLLEFYCLILALSLFR